MGAWAGALEDNAEVIVDAMSESQVKSDDQHDSAKHVRKLLQSTHHK